VNEIDEDELIGAGRSGTVVDGAVDGVKRAVSAELLRKCCLEQKDQVNPRGLRLSRAIIVGCLDLAGLAVPFPLRFDECEFDSPVMAEGAELFELSLTGCPRLPGLLANGLRLRRDLDLSRSHVTGGHKTSASTSKRSAIWLCESVVGGRLLCVDTLISATGERSVQADRMHVGGTVRLLHRFTARGEIRLLGVQIDGSLDLTGAQIECSVGPALDLGDAVIGGSLFLIADSAGRRPVIKGRLDMGSARIAGRLLIRGATLREPDLPIDSGYARHRAGGTAVSAPRLSVGAEMVLEEACDVTGGLDLSMSEMSSMSIGGDCAVHAPGRTALDLTNAQIRAMLRVDQNAVVEGTMRLTGAVIHGTLGLHGQMSHPEHRSLVEGAAMTVDDDVYLDSLRADGGRVNLRGATLGGVHAEGARLHNPTGYTVSLNQATVNGSVRLVDGFTSTGLVVLNRSTIAGRLQLTDGLFTCPAPAPRNEHGHAIEAISATARGGIDLGWTSVSPSVDFTDTVTTFLADDPATWPPQFTIAGLTYDRFETPQGAQPKPVWDDVTRSAWLSRQTAFDSGPYEQAARVFRQHGYAREAERILIAQRRHARRAGRSTATWPRHAADMLWATVGYGYRPWRVAWMLAALLFLVGVSLWPHASQATLRATTASGAVYTTSGPLTSSAGIKTSHSVARVSSPRVDSCGNGALRCFSPGLYAIDTVIPLISLGQRSTWYPDPHVHLGELIFWWLNFATLLGWFLSSIFVVSLARLSRSP
jgi:hypothetical protein